LARRNKREPFNPFAPGASSKTQKKIQKPRQDSVKKVVQNVSRQQQMEAMRKKIKEQQEKRDTSPIEKEIVPKSLDGSEQKAIVNSSELKEVKISEVKPTEVKPTEVKPKEVKPKEVKPREVKPKNIGTKSSPGSKHSERPNSAIKPTVEDSGRSKLEDLKRRSDALAAKTGVQLPKTKTSPGSLFSKKVVSKGNKAVEAKPKKPTKPIRKTKKGGGKQPKQQKLNRRKQLEFRFDARAILDDSDVAEEHRSNVFGQIWAKGERVGVQSAMEYISQKEQEGILTSSVSEQLVALIKSYTIKR